MSKSKHRRYQSEHKNSEHHEHKSNATHGNAHKSGAQEHVHHKQHQHNKRTEPSYDVWKIATFVLAALLVVSIFTNGFNFQKTNANTNNAAQTTSTKNTAASGQDTKNPTTTQNVADNYNGEKAKMEFYVMSKCPYGTQVENAIKPVLDQLGGAVDFSVNYIANDNGDGSFKSLHGQTEVDGNIAQLCAKKYNPDKYMDMVVCQNENAAGIPDNWKQCATENGLDVGSIEKCYTSQEGKDLLKASIQNTNKVGASGSPTMYLNGQPYQGGRDTLSFMRAICSKLEGVDACDSIPACGTDDDCTANPDKIGKCVNPNKEDAVCNYIDPVKMDFIVINDKTCTTCDPTRIISISKQLFPGIQQRNLDYTDAEAQTLMKELGVKMLPVYVFGKELKDAARYPQNKNVFVEAGDWFYLRPSAVGSTHDPTIPEVPKKLDLYVMSKCPYGSEAVKSMDEVLNLFGDQIDFKLHFIANENADGSFDSLHGPTEVAEDIRQVCAYDLFPEKAFKYVECVAEDYTNAETVWEGCADTVGIDKTKLKECSEGTKGTELLKENIKSANDLGIGSSPTFIINNKERIPGAQPADAIKSSLCTANPTLDGCDSTLTQASNVPTGGGCN